MTSSTPASRRSVLRGSVLAAASLGLVEGAAGRALAAGSGTDDGGVVDLPLGGDALLRGGAPGLLRTGPMPVPAFALLGVTWTGTGRPDVRVRARRHGAWSGWTTLPLLHDAPDRRTEGAAGLLATAPHWTGPADGVDVEVRGASGRPVLHLVDPGATPVSLLRHGHHPGHHGHHHGHHGPRGPRAAPEPSILPRSAWGARERWRNGGPYFNHTIKQVHVHHTASGNDYGRDDVPALLRGIYRYHTHALGWSDIAYNFLVDRFGRTWEGRYGGVDRAVRGAHTLGFNGTSSGVAVIGDYSARDPGHRVLTAVVQLAAWKLDAYGRAPAGWTRVRSAGSDRYAAGERVSLPVLDGHRDTNDTECPGSLLYARLQAVRQRAQARADRFDPRDGR